MAMAKVKSKRSTAKAPKRKNDPPAASIAAAQRLLSTVSRKRTNLKAALKRDQANLKNLEKATARHKARLKTLQTDLADVNQRYKAAIKKTG